jgi:hypothetical protein
MGSAGGVKKSIEMDVDDSVIPQFQGSRTKDEAIAGLVGHMFPGGIISAGIATKVNSPKKDKNQSNEVNGNSKADNVESKPNFSGILDDEEEDDEPKLSRAEQIELEKKELELEYLEKEKKLQWENRLKVEKAQEKKLILENNKTFGRLILFWKYNLNRTWKKVVFIAISLLTLNYIFLVLGDGVTYYTDKQKLDSEIQYLRDSGKKLDSLISVKKFDEAELLVDKMTEAERQLGTKNRFLKQTYLDFNRELNWWGGYKKKQEIEELRVKKK